MPRSANSCRRPDALPSGRRAAAWASPFCAWRPNGKSASRPSSAWQQGGRVGQRYPAIPAKAIPEQASSSCSWKSSECATIRSTCAPYRAPQADRRRRGGRDMAGTRAAGSHTAGLASSESAVAALFQQSGVIRADTIDEMFDVAACLDVQPLPPGTRVGIITDAGGPGILAADAYENAGLTVRPLSGRTRAALRARCTGSESVHRLISLPRRRPTTLSRPSRSCCRRRTSDALVVIDMPVDTTSNAAIAEGMSRGIAAGRAAGASASLCWRVSWRGPNRLCRSARAGSRCRRTRRPTGRPSAGASRQRRAMARPPSRPVLGL